MTDFTGSNTPPEHRDKWRTPHTLFKALDNEFHFAIDVAASDDNHLCEQYHTEKSCGLSANWDAPAISYAWCNPPYSNIKPWVEKASQQAKQGIGCVMLVPQDQSVGWFKQAIRHCAEVRIITGGRLAFINAATGLPVKGNNKGSQLLIWRPFNVYPVNTCYVDRDKLLASLSHAA
ncbi:phage N-6-adenine-methyltransferase [Grimontia sp. NTOU-MAR1]|uniref:phage N-6-adenine-methyltransferase n=1 Tax=Grimontia sp. NTOU-MAR1 TaxID=3111011 RepID=UPI002DBD97AE|nr:phage N-6-adenine-methyltransferase [Grimontia sp. NTOU-MAR1]WRV98891.1 phage N-6-adenine-methyltransferase [Grimontia sp. NTOU-MAR1]